MAFAVGVAKRVIIAPEATFGVNPVTGGQILRRVSSDLSLNKDSYESQEILDSQQLRDARHGVRRPQGTFAGQVSPGSFTHFWQGLLRNTFATVTPLVQAPTLDTVAGTLTGTNFNATFKREDIFRFSGITGGNSILNGINLRANNVTNTVITTRDLPTGLTNGALTGGTMTVVGKKLFMPASGAVQKSYTIEHFFTDIGVSEAFTGVRFGQTAIALPATGLVTFNSQMIGQDMIQSASQQLTSPTAATSSSSLAAVNGKLSYNGVDLAMLTGLNIQIAPAMEAPPVVGSNIVPWIFQGPLRVTGSFTALFQDQTVANTFVNETEVGLSVYLTMGSLATSDFMRFTMPRIKAMSNQKSDGPMSLTQSMNFTALENVADATSELSTLVIQDSLA